MPGWAGVCHRRDLARSMERWLLPVKGVGLVMGFGLGRLSAVAERTDETTRLSFVKSRDESLERRRNGGDTGRGLCGGVGTGDGTGMVSAWLMELEGDGTMVGSAGSKVIRPSSFDRSSSRRMSWGMHLSKYFPYSANTRSCKISNRMVARWLDHLCKAIEDRVKVEMRSTRARA